jgi:hypothetical protein
MAKMALATQCHPYHGIVLGNQLKTADITKDFIRFEPNTDPMLANEKVGIGNLIPSIPDPNLTIKLYCHRLPSVTKYPRLSRDLHALFKPGVLNLLVTAYPQSKIVPICVPPNQNCMPFAYPQIINSTQKCFFLASFLISRTPCDLFTYP